MSIKLDAPVGDAELITAARKGDAEAYAALYRRHVGAARRLAHALVRDRSDVDDLVAETFVKVLVTLRGGRGPDVAFRAYLLTTLRHVCYDRARRDRRLQLTDDLTPYEPGVPFEDAPMAELERSYAARAFAKLPERWRMVLWHTEVEGETPAQVAPLLGLTPNGVAALAYRARERLRQMYLQEHINGTGDPTCHWTADRLGAAVRGGLHKRDRSKVDGHLSDCAACRLLHAELAEVNSGLRGVLGPLVLGGAASAYLAGAAKVSLAGLWTAATAWLTRLWGAPRRILGTLNQRYGRSSVAAGAGLALAVLLGTAALAVTLVAVSGTPPRPPIAGGAKPPEPPAVHVPPLPPLPPTPEAASTTPTTTAPAAPPPPRVTLAARAAQLVAGGVGILPVTVNAARTMALTLPEGVRLHDPDAGNGWRCTATTPGASCRRAGGQSTTVRVRVSVAPTVTGFRPVRVVVSEGSRKASTSARVAVAPARTRVAYAVTARARTVLAGNTLLSCGPRPACLAAADNQSVAMAPYRSAAAPGGLRFAAAASGATVAVPRGASVRYAGLFWGAAAVTPPAEVALHGPTGGWRRVVAVRVDRPDAADRPFGQAYADVTALVRAGGAYWVAAPVSALPAGDGSYGGWSLAVVYNDPRAPVVDLALYAGPAAMRGAARLSVSVSGGSGRMADVGVVIWDGDRGLPGDALLFGDVPVLDNIGRGTAAGAVESGWNTLGVDIATLRRELPATAGAVSIQAGLDPIELGLLTIAVPTVPG